MMAIFEYALSSFITNKKGKWAAGLDTPHLCGRERAERP